MNDKKTEKQKKAFKEFVKEHGPMIAMAVGSGLICGMYGAHCCKKGYERGINNGAIYGFHATIHWFDKHFDNLNLLELYENWAKENPDKICTVKLK